MPEPKAPTWGPITPERPLIILQTNNRFNDSDDGFGYGRNSREEAVLHGKEAARAWQEAVPDDIKPYCHLQMELRMQNHRERYERLRRLFTPLEEAGIPINFQFADHHDMYVFDPDYVEKLLEEFPSIHSLTLTEINYEHYRSFNVARYAVSPEARYAMDIIDMAASHGKYLSISLHGLKWLHICTDILNAPLYAKIAENSDYVLAVNEHIGPQHLPRQTSIWGIWLADGVEHWGVEPQSWWFENGRMISPGVFGQYQQDNRRNMPPQLYRAMILQGALLGATIYQLEPFWDLFDYDNSACWSEIIHPTLMEIIRGRMISSKEQCLKKAKVAYHSKHARDINEFHENLRDIDFIHDEGLLARAAYGVWEKFMGHELIPNRSRYFFIPILPPSSSEDTLARFNHVIKPGECNSEAEYEQLLNRYYPDEKTGNAWTACINGYAYVMQSHENLFEEQTYCLELPRPVKGIAGAWTEKGLELRWLADDPRTVAWRILRAKDDEGGRTEILERTCEAHCLDSEAVPGRPWRYAVVAETTASVHVEGTVNYLDFRVFSQEISPAVEWLHIDEHGLFCIKPGLNAQDDLPKSQTVYPTFDGARDFLTEAQEIVEVLNRFKEYYDGGDYAGLASLYGEDYRDANGYHVEYARRAWRFWFDRNNVFCFLRQIRHWDFSYYKSNGTVRVRLFALCRALRRDDAPFGSWYDGTVNIPRTNDEEVIFTWRRDTATGEWKITHTDPALPNFQEILWNSRGSDRIGVKIIPGAEGIYGKMPEAKINLLPLETNWYDPEKNRRG